LSWEETAKLRAGGTAQGIEHLLNKSKALVSNSSTAKKFLKERRKKLPN
jgi:hypothetical protein